MKRLKIKLDAIPRLYAYGMTSSSCQKKNKKNSYTYTALAMVLNI